MSIPTGDKPDEAAKRAKFISDLRALADLLENEPQLPIPDDMYGTAYLQGTTAEKLKTLFALAELLDTDVTHNRRNGVCETEYKRGSVTYCLYASVDKAPAPAPEKYFVASPAQVLANLGQAGEPSAAAQQVQQMQQQLDEIGERLEREGEQLDEAARVMGEAVTVLEERHAERAAQHSIGEPEHVPTALLREVAEQVLNGELFPVGEPVVHAAFYAQPLGPEDGNRGCCGEYGTVTQDPDAVTCPRCLALADTPVGEPSC